MPHSAPSGQTSLESEFAGEAMSLECAGRAKRRRRFGCPTNFSLSLQLQHSDSNDKLKFVGQRPKNSFGDVTLQTAFRRRACNLRGQIGTCFDGVIVAATAIRVISV